MEYAKEFFRNTFTPCSDERINEIEHDLGKQLPEAYRDLLRQTGGGNLDTGKRFIAKLNFENEESYVDLETVLGNTAGNEDITFSPEFNDPEVWGVREGLLVFGYSSGGPGEYFCINYDLRDFPVFSIIFVRTVTETESEMVKAADSFDDFMSNLMLRGEIA